MNFGEQLKQIRHERGLSQESMAELLGTSRAALSQYESGKRHPTIKLLQQFAVALEMPLETLVGLRSSTPGIEIKWKPIDSTASGLIRTNLSGNQLQQLAAVANDMTAEGIAEAVNRFCEIVEIPKYQQRG